MPNETVTNETDAGQKDQQATATLTPTLSVATEPTTLTPQEVVTDSNAKATDPSVPSNLTTQADLAKALQDQENRFVDLCGQLTASIDQKVNDLVTKKFAELSDVQVNEPFVPAVGKVVNFVEDLALSGRAGELVPAIITKVHNNQYVSLRLMGDSDPIQDRQVPNVLMHNGIGPASRRTWLPVT